MKVATLGQAGNPAIVMIPGMFCASAMPEMVAKHLEQDFYLILPTLDGHHREEPVYRSKEDDARKIVQWLQEHDVRELALLQGTSMGAEVALEVAQKIELPVGHCLFDGGPFFHFPFPIRALMAREFWRLRELAKERSEEEVADLLKDSWLGKKLGSGSHDSHRAVLDSLVDISQWVDRDSVRRIADTCYRCYLPAFDKEETRKFTFLYADKEPARKAERRLRKRYPDAEYLIVKGYGHCGYQMEQPEEYAALMRREAASARSAVSKP